ncbi:MAG: signal peptidase I [Acidimicrobiales bacterium]
MTDALEGAPTPDTPADEGPDDVATGPSSVARIVEWLVVIVGSLALALALRAWVVQSFSIPSESMEETLLVGDRLLVEKVSYRFGDPSHGDVVVFSRPPDVPGPTDDLIKRIIGLGGDVIEGRDSVVYRNGDALDEPYLDDGFFGDFGPITVPDGHMFVMGDNRDESLDSRVFGPLSTDLIVGRAFVKTWPLDRLGGL